MNRITKLSLIYWAIAFLVFANIRGVLFTLAIVYGIMFHELGHALVAAVSGNFAGFFLRGMRMGVLSSHRKHAKSSYISGVTMNFFTFPILLPMVPRSEWAIFVVLFVLGSAFDFVKLAKHLFGGLSPEAMDMLIS